MSQTPYWKVAGWLEVTCSSVQICQVANQLLFKTDQSLEIRG